MDDDVGYEDDAEPDLDLSKLTESVWLVKVPKFFFEKIETPGEGVRIGKMEVEDGNYEKV